MLFFALSAALFSCGTPGSPDPPADHDHGDHSNHGHAQHFTVLAEHVELFVEFEPLIVGGSQRFAAHLTDRKTFKPIEQALVTVAMQQGAFSLSDQVDEPVQPGIFAPVLKSKKEGTGALRFIVETAAFTDTITLEDVPVFKHAYAAEQWAHAHESEEDGATTFTKEQAWKIDFATAVVERSTMAEVIYAGGEILPSRGDEVVVTAGAGGLVLFDLDHTILGARLEAGVQMFSIAGGNLVEDNLETEFRQAEATYVQAQAQFARTQHLFEAQAVSRAEMEESALSFELARAEFDNLSRDYGADGKRVEAPTTGYLKDVLVQSGQFVEAGDALAVLAQNKKITLQADVPQSAYPLLRNITTAYFRLAGSEAKSIDDYNGKLLSYGKSVSREEPFIPVQFELDNRGDLLPGTFIEVFIEVEVEGEGEGEGAVGGGGGGGNVLAIPNAALLEQYGTYLVFVQVGGEKFERREVEIGRSNGKRTEIRSGLAQGERIVTRGAYQVKMAGMASSIPAHGHVH
jgi:RND family efflux transporter MFP subunit